MDFITIQQAMIELMKKIDTALKILKERANNKAFATGKYEKALAKTLIGLKNGQLFTLGDLEIINPPASTSEKIARGICFREKIATELADAEYKNAVEGLRAFEAQLTAYQSMNRYVDKV